MNRILTASWLYLFFMSKKKTHENTGKTAISKQESILNITYHESEIEQKYGKFFWLMIPVLAILYYSYRKIAVGFYQDDEVAQYINMLNFWVDPSVILGNGPKPGYKIFMVLPALISYDAVLIFNSIIAAVTVYLTYILLKVYKVNYAFVGALLLASQPMFVGLSFRSYSEIFTALCLVSFLILYKKEKFVLSGLLLGYIFTIRQEIALLIIIIGVIFIRKKQFLPAIALLIFPVLYNLLGFIKTGDIMFVLTEMRSVAGLNYKSQGLMHYFKVYIYIVGPVSLSLFLLGFFGFLNDTARWKEYIQKYFLFYVIFLSVFVIQMLTMLNDGPNPGNWRYLLHISPICAFFAVIGLNNLTLKRFRNTNFLISGTLLVLVVLFLSYATDGFKLLEKSDYTAALYVAFFIGLTIALGASSKNAVNISIALVMLAASYLYFVEPKQLSPENITVKETAEFLDSMPELKDKQKLTNHTFIMFHSTLYKQNIPSFKKLDMKNLNEAPKGSILIWESHYGYRPEFKNDVPFESLQDSTKYRLIKQFVSSDKRFASFIIEKL
jgi:hypothetical protein